MPPRNDSPGPYGPSPEPPADDPPPRPAAPRPVADEHFFQPTAPPRHVDAERSSLRLATGLAVALVVLGVVGLVLIWWMVWGRV